MRYLFQHVLVLFPSDLDDMKRQLENTTKTFVRITPTLKTLCYPMAIRYETRRCRPGHSRQGGARRTRRARWRRKELFQRYHWEDQAATAQERSHRLAVNRWSGCIRQPQRSSSRAGWIGTNWSRSGECSISILLFELERLNV